MKRNIIKVDEEKCNGCGICIASCHEGALKIIDGKAKLVKDSYCDGLGACLPACPMGALEIIERDADDFDEISVSKNMNINTHFRGCPSSRMKLNINKRSVTKKVNDGLGTNLMQWPCQIKLVQSNASFFNNCDLLVAADCTAFAYANIQEEMKEKITIIGCPKLDNTDYSIKLSEIIQKNNVKSITVIRMEVPCCGGVENAVRIAVENSYKNIPVKVLTISTDGKII